MSDIELAEGVRAARLKQINSRSRDRAELERRHGKVWNSVELQADFKIIGYSLPYFIVQRRVDGTVGSVERQERPRFYFNFIPA